MNTTITSQLSGGIGILSEGNTTREALKDDAIFTGLAELNAYSTIMCSCFADVAGTLFFDFSLDGVDWITHPTNGFEISPGIQKVQTALKGPRYFRVRFVNGETTQGIFQLTTYYGTFRQDSAPINQLLDKDADALLVRNIDSGLDISAERISGFRAINKFGENKDIDTSSTPEDLWNGGGLYTFPTSAETLSVVSDNTADDGSPEGTGAWSVRIEGLNGDYEEITETLTLDGTTNVTTTATFLRVNRARVITAGSSGSNTGTLTCTNSISGNTLFIITPTENASQLGLYTVPANTNAYLYDVAGFVERATAASVTVVLRERPFGEVFSTEDHYGAQSQGSNIIRRYKVPKKFTEKTDIIFTCTETTANNIEVSISFDLVLVS